MIHRIRSILKFELIFYLILAFLCFMGCGQRNDLPEEGLNALHVVGGKYFSVAGMAYKKLTWQCESSLVNKSVSTIEDDILKAQMTNSKILIHWHVHEGFGIQITDVPELPDSEHDRRLKAFMYAAKDRVLGAYRLASVVFSGIGGKEAADKLIKYEKTESGVRMVFRGAGRGDKTVFYFDHALGLQKAVQFKDAEEIAVANYAFEQADDGLLYFKELDARDIVNNVASNITFEYGEIDGVLLPKVMRVTSKTKQFTVIEEILILDIINGQRITE